jgi:hypothetical protein
MQTARHRPAAEISRSRAAPVVRRKSGSGAPDLPRDFDNHRGGNAAFRFGKLRRLFGIEIFQLGDEILESYFDIGI